MFISYAGPSDVRGLCERRNTRNFRKSSWPVRNHVARVDSLCVILTSPPCVFNITRGTVRSSYLSMFHFRTCFRFGVSLIVNAPSSNGLFKQAHSFTNKHRDVVVVVARWSKIRQQVMCSFDMKIPVSCALAPNNHSYNRHNLHQLYPAPASSCTLLVSLHMVDIITKRVSRLVRFDVFHRCGIALPALWKIVSSQWRTVLVALLYQQCPLVN